MKPKLLLFLLPVLLLVTSCSDKPAGVSETEEPKVDFKKEFSHSDFTEIIPYDFEVEWSESSTGYSRELENAYYEFPVTRKNKFDSSGRPGHNNRSAVTYKILAVEQEETANFYVLKFMAPADTPITEDISLANLSDFSGHLYLYNKQNERELAQKYHEGNLAGDLSVITEEEFERYEHAENSMYKLPVCYTETIHHYTDWYRRYGDGSVEYIGTTYNGTTYNEVCEDPGSGGSGGGGGTYSEYTSNTTPDHYLSVNPLVKYPEDSD